MSNPEKNFDANQLVREETLSGIYIKPVFTPADNEGRNYETDVADPGVYPYTRGIYPTMYRSRLWQKSFIVSYASPEDTNVGFKRLLANGVSGLRLTEDLPSQMGLDPDHPLAWNTLMCGGVNPYARNVFETVLKDLPLEAATYELGTGGIFDSVYMYSSMAAQIELRGGNIANLKGSGIADPIRSKLVYGMLSWPTPVERRILMDHIEFCMENTPKWKPFAPNGVDPNQAGMNAVHELGAALGSAMAVLDDLAERGHTIDEYGAMVFALDSDSDFFETIAKFRCARRMWAKIAKERYGATKKSAMTLKLGTRTSGLSLQRQKPLNNTARVTLQMLSAVLGGVNAIDACSIDEAMGLPSDEARTFSMDTHNIIIHEANVPLVADPLGGSYYLEWLTDKLETETNAYLKEIEERGGMYKCLESGYFHSVLEADRLRAQREKADGTRLLVGVNAFKGEGGDINKAVSDNAYRTPSVEDRRKWVEGYKAFCASREPEPLAVAIRQLYLDTKNNVNVSRAMIEGVKAGMTTGEVCGVIRMGYGLCYDFAEVIPTPPHVEAALKDIR